MYMKPFHGGGWVNVYRIADPYELQAAPDLGPGADARPGRRRGCLSSPAAWPSAPDDGHLRPASPCISATRSTHGFLTPELGTEIVTFGLTVGAFFRWEFNSFEVIVRDGRCYPIDFANATPDMAIISLHYYFP